jgi:hypothetical protein
MIRVVARNSETRKKIATFAKIRIHKTYGVFKTP